MFDGIETTGVKYDATGSTNNLVYTLSTPIKTRGKINVKYNGQGSGRTIQFNAEPVQTFVNGTGATYRQTELNAPENITQITSKMLTVKAHPVKWLVYF